MSTKERILIIGACGQLGTELTGALRAIYGNEQVIATDICPANAALADGPFQILDVMNLPQLTELVEREQITQIYHLAAILSAKGEMNPTLAWDINMNSLLHVLELAKTYKLRVFWPSSIAAFGTNTPKIDTPQHTVMEPNTVYGVSKLAGELWCQYYFEKYGVDVRSVRYPGLIGYKALPGGGTTDYAVDIYHKAIAGEHFECFLGEETALPMLYMPDAVRGTLELMHADSEKVKIRTSYNLQGISFTPAEIYESIRELFPEFTISYQPDFRQAIAESWPASLDDQQAQEDWGWKPEYDLHKMTADMVKHLREMSVGR